MLFAILSEWACSRDWACPRQGLVCVTRKSWLGVHYHKVGRIREGNLVNRVRHICSLGRVRSEYTKGEIGEIELTNYHTVNSAKEKD